MKRFHSTSEVFDFAIAKEIEAHDLYMELSAWAERPEVAQAFEDFSKEELRHKEKLEAIKAGNLILQDEQVETLNIADSLKATEPRANLTYAQALVLAMQREKEAFKLYLQLASMTQNPDIKHTLSMLAQEEARHKLRIEVEYDLTTF